MDEVTEIFSRMQNNKKIIDSLQQTNFKINRNDPCPCESGKKYKKCCLKAQKEYEVWETRRKFVEKLVDAGVLRIPTDKELDEFESTQK